MIGLEWETTFQATFLGADISVLSNLPSDLVKHFHEAERPAIIMGGAALAKGALMRGSAAAEQLKVVRDGWNGFNVLHFSAARAVWATARLRAKVHEGYCIGFTQRNSEPRRRRDEF